MIKALEIGMAEHGMYFFGPNDLNVFFILIN
jgi:hypothetical protein